MPPPSRLCLSRDSLWGAAAPTRLLFSARGAGWARFPPVPGHPPAPHKSYLEARGSPELPPAQGRRAGIARATSCHRPSSPCPCAWRRSDAGAKRARSEPVPGSLCAQPRQPSLSSLRSPPGGRHVAGPGARPPRPSGTHSGAAAGPASWGLSGLPAPRPARSPRPCRASVRPAGSQPSRAGERTNRAGESRAPAAAPGCLPADCPDLGKGRAGTAGAGLPGPPPHWASSGGGGAKPGQTVPCSPRDPTRARRETPLDQRQRW